VGDVTFYQNYRPVNFRTVNNNDVVPHVPVELQILGDPLGLFRQYSYKHVGTIEYLDRNGQLGGGMSDWDTKKGFVLNALMRNQGDPEPQALRDHHIENYVAAIQRNLA
jgi:hypothetical protein